MNLTSQKNHNGARLPEHLIQLPGGAWRVWQSVCVRGAGFPAQMVLELAASPEVIAAADAVLAAEDRMEHTRRLTVTELGKQFEQTPKQERKPLRKAFRQIRKGRIPSLSNIQSPLIRQLQQAQQDTDALRTEFERHIIRDTCRINEALRKVLKNDTFQEAMIWQNRIVLQRHIGWFLRQPVTRSNRRSKKIERLLANYLQRYCVKNDTIGFFGPVGWGRLLSDSPERAEAAIVYQPGEQVVANRQVFFEQWCIDALAEKLSQQEELLLWLPPCPLPNFYLEGTTLHLPAIAAWLKEGKIPPVVKSHIQLSPVQYRLLHLCDGKRPAKAIAREIFTDSAYNLTEETEVYQLLEQFCELGVLRWRLDLPLELHPERTLCRHLELIDDPALRDPVLSALDELEAAKNAVAQAAGDPEQLNQALEKLETTFTCLTDASPTRRGGRFYAGRTLVYEDCRRDMTLTFGPELLNRLGPPLSLILTSARWFTYRVAQVYREEFTALYQRLIQEREEAHIDLQSFLPHVLPLLGDEGNPLLRTITRELQQRWRDILLPPHLPLEGEGEKRHRTYTSQALRPHIQATFDAPHPGWTLARYRSPDVMLAAPNVEAIQQGSYQFILGEIHLCNTIDNAFIVAQHPHPEELVNAYTRDIPQQCVMPAASAQWSSQRNLSVLSLAKDIRFAYESIPSNLPRSQMITVGELIVEHADGHLRICTRDHRLTFDIIDFFGYTLSTQSIAFPSLLPPASHSPRITIDDLVVCRESWRFNPVELPFGQLPARSDQLLAVRRWAKEHGIPRCVFVKAANEPKPFFVDLDSPVGIEILAKTVRQHSTDSDIDDTIQMTEMLPDFQHLWLFDADGNRYTSELRFVMLDGRSKI